jgi:hypothetical protein
MAASYYRLNWSMNVRSTMECYRIAAASCCCMAPQDDANRKKLLGLEQMLRRKSERPNWKNLVYWAAGTVCINAILHACGFEERGGSNRRLAKGVYLGIRTCAQGKQFYFSNFYYYIAFRRFR